MGIANTYIVDYQLLFIVLPSELPHTHLDEILKGCIHVDILVLQLATAGSKFHLLHQPEDREEARWKMGDRKDMGDKKKKRRLGEIVVKEGMLGLKH